jgi:hypothetical protein
LRRGLHGLRDRRSSPMLQCQRDTMMAYHRCAPLFPSLASRLLALAAALSAAQCGGSVSGDGVCTGCAADAATSSAPDAGCPEGEPSEGAPCDASAPPSGCSYGASPRPDCRDLWTCDVGRWHAVRSGCPVLPTGYCPTEPSPGANCVAIPDPSARGDCAYDGGVLCGCPWCAGVPACTPAAWVCYGPPHTPGCPAIVPNLGTPCAVQGTQCVYGDPCEVNGEGATLFCRAGRWDRGATQCSL